jgi:hypothetical protein
MEEQDQNASDVPQTVPSREELEQHLRTRAWKDDAFRQEFLAHPETILERDYARYFPEGQIPSELSIKAIEEDEQSICFVLPPKCSDNQPPDVDEELLDKSKGAGYTGTCGTACGTCYVTCHWTCGCSKLGLVRRL